MFNIVLIAFVTASSPTPPPPTKEVVIEHLVGLPAKREEDEAVLPTKRVKGKRERGYGDQNTICEQKFDNPRSYNRRGNRNH